MLINGLLGDLLREEGTERLQNNENTLPKMTLGLSFLCSWPYHETETLGIFIT